MGVAHVEFDKHSVRKTYPEEWRAYCQNEVLCYLELPWATPRLLDYGDTWFEVERLWPITWLPKEFSKGYRQPLWELLRRVHDAGWWHLDVALVNVVVSVDRGPLLIDWEAARRAQSSISWDLHGAVGAGVESNDPRSVDGTWWGGPWIECPGRFWAEENIEG